MENNQFPSSKLLTFNDEKVIREVDYDSGTSRAHRHRTKPFVLDLEIIQGPEHNKNVSKLLVTIKPKAPIIKTIYETSHFYSREGSNKSASQLLGIGDHYSITSRTLEVSSESNCTDCQSEHKEEFVKRNQLTNTTLSNVSYSTDFVKSGLKVDEKCLFSSPLTTMNVKTEIKTENQVTHCNKIDKATLIVTNTSSEESSQINASSSLISEVYKRIDSLERKFSRQQTVFRKIDPMLGTSSDEDNAERPASPTKRHKHTFIEQYSHVPETSAFHRYMQPAPLSPSKATTIEKEHNSEQYGRDFTTYDGITTRGRRQCASVPLKKDEGLKIAAERVHKIRHKLNPVRDYRLMDTMHYLAQGEFAPRDDGIKLTPSREAVLSDIIYEDVCRTHWPTTRLARTNRVQHADRCCTRYELQRLIDNLLRERVAHVERRRRRHYRIVKLNHRHENCKPLGKTGDIIVASHKHKSLKDRRDAGSDHVSGIPMLFDHHYSHRSPRSHDRCATSHMYDDKRSRRKSLLNEDDCLAGPSHAIAGSAREEACCYHTKASQGHHLHKIASNGSRGNSKTKTTPRLLIKKEVSRRKHQKEQPNLEHYILLPTLVVRTPSNIKRQKKFNELYHRILNYQFNNERDDPYFENEAKADRKQQNTNKKDISFNINIVSSESDHNKK